MIIFLTCKCLRTCSQVRGSEFASSCKKCTVLQTLTSNFWVRWYPGQHELDHDPTMICQKLFAIMKMSKGFDIVFSNQFQNFGLLRDQVSAIQTSQAPTLNSYPCRRTRQGSTWPQWKPLTNCRRLEVESLELNSSCCCCCCCYRPILWKRYWGKTWRSIPWPSVWGSWPQVEPQAIYNLGTLPNRAQELFMSLFAVFLRFWR